MVFRQAASRIELSVPQESHRRYYADLERQINSLGFEDVDVVQRHGLHADAGAHFQLTPNAEDGIITAYQEYRIASVILDMNREASQKARRMSRIAPKIRMKVLKAELPEPKSAFSDDGRSDEVEEVSTKSVGQAY